MRQSHKTILLWAVLILMFYLIYNIVSSARSEVQEVSFSTFLDAVEVGTLTNAEIEIHNETEFFWTDDKVRKKAVGKLTDNVLETLDHK